jgi:hypothetical protein
MLATKPLPRMVGISTVLSQHESVWDLWADLGVKSVRVEFFWSEIEANRGQYKWQVPDLIVQRAANRDINLFVVVNYAPAWAKTDMGTWHGGVENFAAKLGERYKCVPVWEIFNEPNWDTRKSQGYGWPWPEVDATEAGNRYGLTVDAFHNGFRSQNTEAGLVAGALTPHGLDVAKFIDAFVGACEADQYDAFSVHPYSWFGQLRQAQNNVRQYLLTKGHDKPVWMSEMGHNQDNDRALRMNQVFAEVPYLDAFFWFCEQDFKLFGYNYGSVEYWGTKKPDYPTLKAHMRNLSV